MSPERWRPFSSEPGPDDPQYYYRQNPSVTAHEAYTRAYWIQLAGSAGEMWEHLQYVEAGNPEDSPYFRTSDVAGDQEKRAIAPFILKFVRFIQHTHPHIAEDQLMDAVRVAMYEPGVLDLVRLVSQMEESGRIENTEHRPWFERGFTPQEE